MTAVSYHTAPKINDTAVTSTSYQKTYTKYKINDTWYMIHDTRTKYGVCTYLLVTPHITTSRHVMSNVNNNCCSAVSLPFAYGTYQTNPTNPTSQTNQILTYCCYHQRPRHLHPTHSTQTHTQIHSTAHRTADKPLPYHGSKSWSRSWSPETSIRGHQQTTTKLTAKNLESIGCPRRTLLDLLYRHKATQKHTDTSTPNPAKSSTAIPSPAQKYHGR